MITVESTISAPIDKIWKFWTEPTHIQNWNNASPDWHTPKAKNDLRVGGKFSFTMAAKDGSFSFDFEGTYTTVIPFNLIEYTIVGGRKVTIGFITSGSKTTIQEMFDPEDENSHELQQQGWQAILDNFKKYTEAN